jgi:CubicO group peptidase (beta-lactamase class C family)
MIMQRIRVERLADMNRVAIVLMMVGVSVMLRGQGLTRATPDSVGLDPRKLQDATQLLKQFVAEQKIAGAVAAVARRGKVAYLESVGVQDLETRVPMSERSVFRIYSMTRAITAVAAMTLHEEGRFKLTDPIAKYLPEFRDVMVAAPEGRRRPQRDITVEDLLLHTSGINDRQSELYRQEKVRSRAEPLAQLMANIVRVGLMEDPGTRHRYGESTSVVGRLIEVWSGQTLDVFFEERIFKPLKMADTGFVVRPDQKSRWTTAYAPAQGGGLVVSEVEDVPFTEKPALLEGTVGLVTTVPDYLRFCQMLLNGGELDGVRVLPRAVIERMTTNGLPEAVLKQRGRGDVGWGLVNANVVLDAGSPLRGEYSWDGTAGTIFWIDPAREMITLLFAPARPSNPDGLRQKFKAVVQQAMVP